jgi:hypothetical protein
VLGVAAAAPALELQKLAAIDATGIVGDVLGAFLLWSWPRTEPGIALDGVVKPGAHQLIESVAAHCLVGIPQLAEEAALGEVLKLSGLISIPNLLADPDWARVLKINTPRAAASGPPVFVAQGTGDTVIAPQTTYDYVARLCAKGRVVTELRLPAVDHLSAGAEAASAFVAWATARLAGAPAANNCVAAQNARSASG